ncbi:B-cell linker protein isoform X2 [Dipodomys spectabilis]|uniref:B-cell linker protein isoform X2 n=1 Tax=Dipodomys spectabilis TaxID=105255 RepID=UPI001C537D2C|nr:B-cell linker protein isoform X2 [Dipodomys spectabilis]
MDKLNKITVPASQKLRQLQKIVHDIKNNEGGIMDKIKKLKVKAPPSVPRRDYDLESPADEGEQWSDDFDSDYENPDEHSDSEMYVMPAEENGDDSYEPPPAEHEMRTIHPALPFTRGEYVDNRSSQRQSPPFSKTLPSKPSWPSAKTRLASTMPASTALQKPQVPPKPRGLLEAEADYVVPVEDNENYIHPTESGPLPSEKAPLVNRSTKPNSSSKPTPLPGTPSGRNSGAWDSKSSSPSVPSPLPRVGRKTATPLKITPVASQQATSSVCEEKPIPAERHRGSSHRQEAVQSPVFPPALKPLPQKPIPLPRFPEGGSPSVDGPSPNFSSNPAFSVQEADVHSKPWYAGSCDRKSAEEALHRSNKYFGSVAEIIKNHQHNPLVLIDSQNNTKDSTRLKYAVKVS